MSDLYKRANAGRLTFKGGELAAVKSIDKKKAKKKKKLAVDEQEGGDGVAGDEQQVGDAAAAAATSASAAGGEQIYTIDAAKKLKYEELFPVESRKFGYDPANKSRAISRSVEEALDDRVKKKADRYCK